MAEAKTINTRLVLRNDTLANWQSSTKPLLKGEAALAFDGSNVQIVIGEDGVKTWKDLSGNASTIGNLKFGPDNIVGLDNRILDVETNTSYQIVSDTLSSGETGNSFKLQSKGKKDSSWSDVEGSRFNVPAFDPSTIEGRLDTLESQMSGDAEGSVNKRIEDKGTVLSGYAETKSGEALTSAKSYTDTVSSALCIDYTTKANAAEKNAKDYTDALSTAVDTKLTGYVQYTDVNQTVTETNKIATLADIVGLSGSVHILGTIENDESTSGKTDQTVIVSTYPNAKRGAIVINTTNSKEYICMAAIGATATAADWIELGSESIYETKADATAKLAEAKSYTDTKISTLDSETTNDSSAKTIDKITEVDGVVTATFKDIQIAETQVTNLTTDLSVLSDLIGAEETRATGVESGLRTDLDGLSGKYETFVGTTYVNDKQGIYDTISSVSSSIESELAAEVTARSDADESLSTLIGAEKTRAEGVESGLRTDIDTVSADLDSLEANAILSIKFNDQYFDVANNLAEITISCINCGGAN